MAKGGCTMTLLEVLALLTLVFTVIYEAVDITLKIMQYIDEKHNKKRLTAQPRKLVRSIFLIA